MRFRTAVAIDLTVPPFEKEVERWTHPTDYTACRPADTARLGGIQVVRYRSARDPRGKEHRVVDVRGVPGPARRSSGRHGVCISTRGAQDGLCDFPEQRMAFDRLAFARDPRIASINWER